ncbi:MAG: hypothetical protein KGQ52_14785 [Alphaproteobacteria bacterium]|nr:hypothetical protein [Alphaproteobacteria bacterium]
MRIQILACASAVALMIGLPATAQPAPAAPAAGTTTRTIDNAKVTGTVTTTRDPAAGQFSRTTELTRKADGATSASTYTRTRTETGFTETGTFTGPQGNTLNLTGNVARANGTLTANRALTNAAGETVASRSLTATRAANGQVTRNVTTTGPQRLLNRIGRPAGARPARP